MRRRWGGGGGEEEMGRRRGVGGGDGEEEEGAGDEQEEEEMGRSLSLLFDLASISHVLNDFGDCCGGNFRHQRRRHGGHYPRYLVLFFSFLFF